MGNPFPVLKLVTAVVADDDDGACIIASANDDEATTEPDSVPIANNHRCSSVCSRRCSAAKS